MTSSESELATRLTAADQLFNAMSLDEAIAAYQEILAIDPTLYAAQLGLARALTRQRRHEEARAAIEQCIALAPERPEGYAALGVLLFLLDETQAAREQLEKALSLSPSDPEATLTLAQVLADAGEQEAAQQYLAAARATIDALPEGVDRDAMNALAWHAQTYLHLVIGDNVAAREAAQQVIALREANPYAASLAYSNLGILEAQAKNYDQAIDYLEQAYALNPRFYRATSALGRILLLRRQYDRAAQVLATLVEHPFADQAMDRYLYAMALAKSGQRQAALEQYRAALAHGLKGIFRLQAHWQVIWLSQFGRYAVIGVGLAAVLAYLLIAKPDGSALSLLAIAVVIFVLQRLLGRPRH